MKLNKTVCEVINSHEWVYSKLGKEIRICRFCHRHEERKLVPIPKYPIKGYTVHAWIGGVAHEGKWVLKEYGTK